MSRKQKSLWLPAAFAFFTAVFAALTGYAWWMENRAVPRVMPVATAPAAVVRSVAVPRVSQAPPPRGEPQAAAKAVNKCLGADQVPIYTSSACPSGSRLEKQFEVELDANRERSRARSAAASNAAAASATASVVNVTSPAYYGPPSRQQRMSYDEERAWHQCERARVRERAELLALGNRRKMSDIREWADYVVRECATYEVLAGRR
jgi:hypothetical protein